MVSPGNRRQWPMGELSVTGFAYVVMANARPSDVLGHVRRIRRLSPAAHVLLRSAAGSPVGTAVVDAEAVAVGATPFRSRIQVRWGDWSLTDAAVEALAEARRRWDPDHLVLVSGEDHPVRDLQRWEGDLTASGVDAVLRPDARDYGYRWQRCWHPVPAATSGAGPVLRPLARAAHRFHSPVGLDEAGGRHWMWHHARRTPPVLPYAKGSFWCVLSRSAADVVLAAAARPEVSGFFGSTLLPDESFVHSVLRATDLRIHDGPTSYTVFPAEDIAHARLLTAADVEDARRSGAPFARKVLSSADGTTSTFAVAVDARVDGERLSPAG